ncbi:hypothetical protein CFOL_v3_07985, partial [Cephalotus follicularis]
FLKTNPNSIKAIVGDTHLGADTEMIESLPCLEIVASTQETSNAMADLVIRNLEAHLKNEPL